MWQYNYTDELYHHGTKGMKWGARHYQNKDGSLTNAGKKKYSDSKENPPAKSSKKKKIIAGVAVGATVAAATYLYIKNKPAADALMKSVGSKTMSSITTQSAKGKEYLAYKSAKAINLAQTQGSDIARKGRSAKTAIGMQTRYAAKDIGTGIREGAAQGMRAAPGKVAKVAVEGATTIAAVKMLKSVVGNAKTDRYISAYNSFNKKNKINMTPFKKDDDDE